MAENQTKKTNADPLGFLNSVEDEQRREDSLVVASLMGKITGEEPKMWGTTIVGFGDIHFKYASGREVDYFKVGLSPRKASLTLYLTPGFQDRQELLSRLGKHTTGKSCLYIKNLDEIDMAVLDDLIRASLEVSWS